MVVLLLLPSKSSEPENPVQEIQIPSESTIPDVLPDLKIAGGVAVSGISVGGMTAEEATDTIRLAVSDVYEKENMVLSVGEHTIKLYYYPQGFWPGFAVSVICAAAFAALCVYVYIFKKRKNKPQEKPAEITDNNN